METNRARQLLEDRRRDLESVARVATEQGSLNQSQADSAGEMSAVDQHQTDLASDTLERELDFSVREGAEASLRDVERALGRIDGGTYGVCPACNGPIPDERLEVRPEAEYCVQHEPRAG